MSRNIDNDKSIGGGGGIVASPLAHLPYIIRTKSPTDSLSNPVPVDSVVISVMGSTD